MDTEQFGDTLDLDLSQPIKLGDLEFATLKLSEPTGEQLLASYKETMPLASLMTLIALNAGVSPAVPKRMRQRDLQRADDFFSHFGRPATSSASETSPQS